ncbi:RiPP maturation radical SAM protein 1 [Pseudoduganella sp. DS3]|uniref:RiPP maturation radical SAM protein 1 n=1 Tax=Pseudoduganella guangdongensis TaxID=2692179 RepID=A0A6N9HK06_9BURK|nr:RiPP maturation radical SAM C-methyltransferase [Pseudoduganella guangdongensis]MYN03669.1 RiPP maturation radical SAM protein 1 [Pseudoduganella guangdongensis]
MASAAPRVLLASMPWATYAEPSLGLATLKAVLDEAQVASRVMHLNLGLLRHISADTFTMLAAFWGINEFLFSGALDPRFDEAQAACLVERCRLHAPEVRQPRYRSEEELLHLCLALREDVIPRYLDECAQRVLEWQPTLVGLSCMFDQTLASVALARRLKALQPGLPVVLGGYALEGRPGDAILSSFPFIDAVARGDGEPQIVRLAQASVGAGALGDIPGVALRGQPAQAAQQADLGANPPPSYSDWFADLDALQRDERVIVRSQVLPVEASRGCWWGQHKHCVFCGIDEQTLKYRAKPAQRVLQMLAALRERYGDHVFRFSDYILPRQYYDEMLDALAGQQPRYRLMGEIKANQTSERLQRFAAAGFIELQPGIESFSSEVLRLMDKGVRGIHNVLTLKSGYRNRIQINYNVLYGLPGEQAGWYRAMLLQLPKLYHLTPPVSRTETIVTRFAPLQADPARFGLSPRPRHHRCYDLLFAQDWLSANRFALDDCAYYFARGFDYPDELAGLYRMLVEQVEHWKGQHRARPVYLYYDDEPVRGEMTVHDSRFGEARVWRLRGLARQLMLACDERMQTLEALRPLARGEGQLEVALAALVDEQRLFWREGEHVLSLAVPGAVWRTHAATGWTASWTANYC